MKQAGIREARQNLTALLEEVRKGHEVTITDRGKPVARLVPPRREQLKPFMGRADFRRRMPVLAASLTAAVIDERSESG
jgi:prevent-host-death family protein